MVFFSAQEKKTKGKNFSLKLILTRTNTPDRFEGNSNVNFIKYSKTMCLEFLNIFIVHPPKTPNKKSQSDCQLTSTTTKKGLHI